MNHERDMLQWFVKIGAPMGEKFFLEHLADVIRGSWSIWAVPSVEVVESRPDVICGELDDGWPVYKNPTYEHPLRNQTTRFLAEKGPCAHLGGGFGKS